jgi:hypothetical protein
VEGDNYDQEIQNRNPVDNVGHGDTSYSRSRG